MSDLVQHAEGVWLNMRHADHVADCGVGSDGMKWFAANPIEAWWRSAWNPMRPVQPPKPAFELGTAAHVAFLDGLKVYNRIYGFEPTKALFPEHLDTIWELQAVLRGAGLSPSYVHKSDLIERIRKHRVKIGGVPVKLLETEHAKWRRKARIAIEPKDDAIIRLLHRMAMKSPEELGLPGGQHLRLRDAFRGALTEVSIFWVDANGIRQRARFDLLKPNISGDVKTITEWRPSDFKQSLLREAVIRSYVLQWVHYDEARRQLRIAVAEGRVFGGTAAQRAKLDLIAEAEEWAWMWVFLKMEGAPQVRGILPDRESGQYKKALAQREQALAMIIYYREIFGMDQMWVDTEVVWTPSDTDWPEWSVLPDAA